MNVAVLERFPVGVASYHNLTIYSALDAAGELMSSPEPAEIFFLNIDGLRLATEDAEYRAILQKTALVLPDGIGIRLATRAHGGHLCANCNGTDLSPKLMAIAARRGKSVFLLGATEPVVLRTADVLERDYPGLRIAGTHHGYFSESGPVIETINNSGADLLFVGMGAPRQEKWIGEHRSELRPRLCVGVGNLFSWISGEQTRAPPWIQHVHLEWAWRILLEPRRLFRRYVLLDMPFLMRLTLSRMNGPKIR